MIRAITYSRFGPAQEVLELTNMATPSPQPGEVLVRLHWSGVNPSDAKARAGARPGVTKPAYPVIVPHSDGSGVIEAIGDGVAASRIGQRVWIWNGQWQRPFGTAAEMIALPSDQAVAMPDDIDLQIGATLGIPGLTAAHCVFGDGTVSGQTLLISGGAGAVGHNAVQLAKWGGAKVIATASKTSVDRVCAAGADHCFDYADPDLASKILKASGGGINRAVEVEFGVNAALLGEVMSENSTIAAYGSGQEMAPVLPFGPYLFKAIRINIVLIYILLQNQRTAAIERLHAALGQGALAPAIHGTYPLKDCAKAHDAVMAGNRRGAILLDTR